MTKTNKILALLIPALICVAIGSIQGSLQTEAIYSWYPFLIKSPLTPPNYVFPIVWTILYITIGISLGLILISQCRHKILMITLWGLQLTLNILWPIAFFNLFNPLAAFIILLLLITVLAIFLYNGFRLVPKAATILIPYMLWLLFASYLNLYILANN